MHIENENFLKEIEADNHQVVIKVKTLVKMQTYSSAVNHYRVIG